MDDIEKELIARLRRGTNEPLVEVTPGPKDDPEAALIAKLRSEMLTDRVIAPTKENPRGHSIPVADWNMGSAVANGMAQGWWPEMLAVPRSGGLLEGGGTTPEFNSKYEQNVKQLREARSAYEKENPGKALVGELGGSMATAIPAMAAGAGAIAPVGRAAVAAAPWLSSVADFLAGSSRGLTRIPSLATRGAVEGTGAAAVTSGLSEKPLPEQLKTGALVGAIANPLLGKVGDLLSSHVSKTSAETAQALLDNGIPVRAGQIPGSNKVAQGLDKVFGGGNAQQREAFGEKLTGFAGLPEKEVSQAWVAKNDARIGKTMNDIQSVYSIPALENGLLTDLQSIRNHATSNMSVENAKKVSGFIDKIEENTLNPMNGAIYKNITQKGGMLDNMRKDKDISNVVPKLREALDEAWGRALPVDKKAAWDQARKEYRITRVIDDSMGATGAAEGVYNPKKLLKAVEDRYGNVENAGELGLLARGGQFLEPPGAAPASSHGMSKMLEKGALVAGGAGAAAAGGHVYNHISPDMILQATQHPETYALPLAGLASAWLGAKGANWAMNRPQATQYLLDVSRGSREPMLRGTNPLLPMLVEGYNQQ